MADTIRERCEKRLSGLKQVRMPYEPDWTEIASLAAPARSRFLGGTTLSSKRRGNSKLYDGHGRRAFRTLTGGMTSGLSSRSRPWFRLTLADDGLMNVQAVKIYLAEVEQAIYAFLNRTNFYSASQTGYLELGLFGTEATVMVEHLSEGAVCHSLTAGEYWIACSDAMKPDTLYRQVPLSVMQVVQMFGGEKISQNVRTAWDQGRYDEIINVFHAVEPNYDRVPGRMDAKGKRWRSIWWDERDQRKDSLLRESGYDDQCFWAPRWETTGADVYGTSPGWDALPDLRELQLQMKRKREATDHHVKPEMIVPTNVKLKRIPGNVVSAAAVDAKGIFPAYQVPYQTIEVVRKDIIEVQRAVDMATYADLFLAITNMQGVQPRNVEEIASRNEEKLTQLGPVIERVENEKLQVAIDRAYAILERGRLLPPPPEELHNVEIKIEFVSILAQMQRMIGLGQLERSLGFTGQLAAAFPEVLDNVDSDAVLREYYDRAGTPPKSLRGMQDVEKIRASRAQQQKMERAVAMLPAVRDGADAARLLSETDAGGGRSLLEGMTGQ